jgi:hypothetical protein
MPSISIDLPMTKHGYLVQADEVFWVNQGILRSTDLRDSMDEQCIADIAAGVVGGEPIERSKDALDEIYVQGSTEADRVLSALEVYGPSKFSDEFNYCIDEIKKVCAAEKPEKLRGVVFKKSTTNPFPSVFAVLIIAFHELIIKEAKKVTDYSGVKRALTNLSERIETGRKATSPDERRKNIDTVKGLVGAYFVKGHMSASEIYGSHTTIDVESVVRRSEIELANYELKQGLLFLSEKGGVDENIIDKVVKTICAIANNGPESVGKIIIGVTDKDNDAARIQEIDKIDPKKIGKRFVVGVNREAKRLGITLGITVEQYFSKWKDGIRKSTLSSGVRDSVLSNIDFNSFYGLGVIVNTIPSQSEPSYIGEEVYWRNGDSTERAETPKQIATLAKRF